MTQLASATIDILARTKRFEGPMKRVRRLMESVRLSMQALSAQARRVLFVASAAIGGFIALASAQEEQEDSLDSALQANGASLEVWSSRLRAAAAAIQEVTTFGDEFLLGIMAQILNLGVSADRVEEVTRASIGLATALKQDLNSAVRNMVLAFNGQFTMLGRYIPALRTTTDEVEKLDIVMQLATGGFAQAEAAAKTFRGRLEQLKNSLGDVGEVIGMIFLPRVLELVQSVKSMIPGMQNWIRTNQEAIKTATKLAIVVTALLAAVTPIITGLLGLKVALIAASTGATILKTILDTAAAGGVVAAAGLAALVPILGGIAFAIVKMREAAIERTLANAEKQSVKFAKSLGEMRSALQDLDESDSLVEQKKQLERIVSVLKEVKTEQDITGASTERIERQIESYSDKLVELDRRMRLEIETAKEAAQKEVELGKAVDVLREKLQTAIATFGDTSIAVELYKLQLRGATEQQLEMSQALEAELEGLRSIEQEFEKAGAAAGTAAGRIASLLNEIEVLSGRATADELELIDLDNLGLAEHQLNAIRTLMEDRARLQGDRALQDEADALKRAAQTEKQRLKQELDRVAALQQAGALTAREAEIIRQSIKDRGRQSPVFQAAFEGLQATFRRIQSAAATPSQGDPTVQAVDKGTRATQDVVTATKAETAVSEKVKGGIDRLIELWEQLLTSGGLRSKFG